MSDSQPQRSASVPVNLPEPVATPKRTFTLPTGEPLTVVPAPSAAPVEVIEKPKLLTVVEPASSPAVSPLTESPAVVPVASEPVKIVEAVPVVTALESVKTEDAVTSVETVKSVEAVKTMEPAPPVVVKSVETAAPVVVPIKAAEPTAAVIVPVKTVEPVLIPVKPADTAMMTVVQSPEASETTKIEMVDKQSMQVVEQTTSTVAVVPVQTAPTAVAIVQTTQYTGRLDPLKRRIAIFSSYVALSSTTIRFSDSSNQQLLDAAGQPIFRLENRHNLCDNHGVGIACLHKSFGFGRWHVEAMKHQTRLMTARRTDGGVSMRLTVQNCFTDKAEDLLYFRGKLFDGMDPATNKVAVLLDRDGVVQVAKGFDVGIAAILAFVVNAWDWKGSRVCCFLR